MDNDATRQRRRARRKGCLGAGAVVLAIMLCSAWQIREPGRRADRVRKAIRTGMSLDELENLVSQQKGRQYVGYRIFSDGKTNAVSRDEFARALAGVSTGAACRAGIRLTFMGISPGRVSFDVEFGDNGEVSGTREPYGWD